MYKCIKITHHTLEYCQTPVQVLGLGVDFVFAMSQEEEEPHQNIPEGNIVEVLNLAKSLTKQNQTHVTLLLTLTLLPDIKPFIDKVFLDQNIFEPKIFSDPKIFWAQNLF